MSDSEGPLPPEAYAADSGHGAATATEPQRDATTPQDNIPQDNTQHDNIAQDNTQHDNIAQDNTQQNTEATDGAQANLDAADDAERPSRAPSDGQLQPDTKADDPVAALWGADLVDGYRTRWQALQLGFVDDPHAATQDAARLVDEAVQSLTDALGAQKQSLDEWQAQDRGDTEVLRTKLQSYREFLDRLLGM